MADITSFLPLWGTWQVDQQIGQGSYGKVYRAFRTEYGQTKTYYSAIKHISIPKSENEIAGLYSDGILNDSSSLKAYYDNVLQRLLREIEINVSLKGHTNIVSYEDHLVIPKPDGPGYDVFIRMELLTPLPQLLQQRAITEAEVRKIGVDMCTALEVMGRNHILHRDIKPSNIFVNDSGDFKLGDFGVSRSMDNGSSGVTIAGTFNYMAPELNRGQNVSFSSDLYSLGLVLYRLCNANRPPFAPLPPANVTADELERSNALRFTGQPLPPPAYASPALQAIIQRSCEFDPARRFASASEMRSALLGQPYAQATRYQQTAQRTQYSNARVQAPVYTNAEKPANNAGGGLNGKLIIMLISVIAVLLVLCIAIMMSIGGDRDNTGASEPPVETSAPVQTVRPDSSDDWIYEEPATGSDINVFTPAPTPVPTPEPLISELQLENLLDNYTYNSTASVYVDDIGRDTAYGTDYSGSTSISSALINIPILLTVMYNIENGYMEMNDTVYFDYVLSGRGSISSAYDGDYLTIQTLMNAMLQYSDNNAANALMNALGYDYIEQVCSYYGFNSVIVNANIGYTSSGNENWVSASDVAGMLKLIWSGEFSGGRSYLRTYMYISDSTARSGLGAYIDSSYNFMNHNGIRSDLYNEVAIIEGGGTSYIVVFMGCGDTQSQLAYCAGEVGTYVHNCLK